MELIIIIDIDIGDIVISSYMVFESGEIAQENMRTITRKYIVTNITEQNTIMMSILVDGQNQPGNIELAVTSLQLYIKSGLYILCDKNLIIKNERI